jgi:hypothetical protein
MYFLHCHIILPLSVHDPSPLSECVEQPGKLERPLLLQTERSPNGRRWHDGSMLLIDMISIGSMGI